MAKVVTDDIHYKNIASSIRQHNEGDTSYYEPSEMAEGVAKVYAKGKEAGKEEVVSPIRETLIDRGAEIDNTASVEEIAAAVEDIAVVVPLKSWREFFSKSGGRIDIVDKVNTKCGTDFYRLFANSTLITAPLLDTSNAESVQGMFYACSALTTIPQYNTSNATDFSYMFYGCTVLNNIPLLDMSNATTATYMFYNCKALTTIPQLDFSNCTSTGYVFQQCTSLVSVPKLETSKSTNFASMFQYCEKLKTVESIDVSSASSLSGNMFYNCKALENLTFVGTIAKSGLAFTYSTLLSHDSLMSIINALADKSADTTTTWTVTLNATNLAKLTDAEKAIATEKGWTLA